MQWLERAALSHGWNLRAVHSALLESYDEALLCNSRPRLAELRLLRKAMRVLFNLSVREFYGYEVLYSGPLFTHQLSIFGSIFV